MGEGRKDTDSKPARERSALKLFKQRKWAPAAHKGALRDACTSEVWVQLRGEHIRLRQRREEAERKKGREVGDEGAAFGVERAVVSRVRRREVVQVQRREGESLGDSGGSTPSCFSLLVS